MVWFLNCWLLNLNYNWLFFTIHKELDAKSITFFLYNFNLFESYHFHHLNKRLNKQKNTFLRWIKPPNNIRNRSGRTVIVSALTWKHVLSPHPKTKATTRQSILSNCIRQIQSEIEKREKPHRMSECSTMSVISSKYTSRIRLSVFLR